MRQSSFRIIVFCLFVLYFVFGHVSATAQPALTKITYLLSVDENTWASYRVSITLESNDEKELIFALPGWLPEFRAKLKFHNLITNFKAYGENNSTLSFEKISENRWLVYAGEQRVLRVIYDVNIKKIADFAPLLSSSGTIIYGPGVFMFVENHLHLPVTARFIVPAEWKIASSLRPSAFFSEYFAKDYQELIDSPVQMGDFQDLYFSLKNKTVYTVFNQTNRVNLDLLLSSIRKIARVQIGLFDEIPFDKYFFFIQIMNGKKEQCCTGFTSACTVQIPASESDQEIVILPKIAREFFRQWLGKRIRSELPGFKYDQPPVNSGWWFVEGVAAYYADLTMIRAGIWQEPTFIGQIANKIAMLEKKFKHQTMTLEEAGFCISGSDFNESLELMRTRGYLAALFLDLQVREFSQNQKSLDDVLRFMNEWFAKFNTDFKNDEILKAVNSISQNDFHLFFNKYISGTTELPYKSLLDLAGYDLKINTYEAPDLGELPELSLRNRVISLDDASVFEQSGVKIGDEIIALDSLKLNSPRELEESIRKLSIDSDVTLVVRRNKVRYNLSMKVGKKNEVNCRLVSLADASAAQIEMRNKWLGLTPKPVNKKP